MYPRPDSRDRCLRPGTAGRRALWSLVGAIIVALAWATAALGTNAQTLTVTVTKADVSATGGTAAVQLGGPAAANITALPPGALTVSVDGQEAAAKTAPARSNRLPNATVLLIDDSGSMQGPAIAAAKTASARFIDGMRPGDLVSVQAFNEDFRELQPFTDNQAALKASLGALAPRRETALYDAVIQSLATFSSPSGGTARKASSRSLVLLSDGGDTASAATLDQALEQVRASGIQMYSIGLKTREFDARPLQQLAAASGGRYSETPDPTALAALYETIAKEIHNQYLVTFALPDTAKTGAGMVTIVVRTNGTQAEGSRGFFYPDKVAVGGPQPVKATSLPPFVDSFLRWPGSDLIVVLIVCALLFLAFYAVSSVLLPRRDVLAEYTDILDNRRRLGPQPAESPKAIRGGERLVDRLLSVRGYAAPLEGRLEDAGWAMRASEFALIQLIAVVVAAVATVFLPLPFWAKLLIMLAVVIGPFAFLDYKATKRRRAFERQVPDLLIMMASSLKAGQGFEQALHVVAEEGPDPAAHEFRRILAQQRLGVSPEDTLRGLADRMQSEGFDWVVMATIIQRQVGGNLAEIYEKIAYTLREREKLRREAHSLTAEGRISALILIALPIFLLVFLMIINPEYEKMLFTTKPGIIISLLALAAMGAGVLWIRRIIRFDI